MKISELIRHLESVRSESGDDLEVIVVSNGGEWRTIKPSRVDDYDGTTTWLYTESRYITRSGRVLTEADIEKLVEEAEIGYDPEKIRKRI